MPKKPRYIFDGMHGESYVRAWKEGRSEIVVQVWKNKKEPTGEPDGDWAMPKALGPATCIAQAILQS